MSPSRTAPAEPTPLTAILMEHIRAWGPITFAKYMDACLYHPQHGYYTKQEQSPRRDYFTSVDAKPIFARLLARQFREMWVQLGRPKEFLLVEPGAGTGALAAQILDFTADALPEFYAALRYVAVERSGSRRAAAQGLFAKHLAADRFAMASDLPAEIPCGCLFSNEFFDALPVHRLVCEGHDLRETYVGCGTIGLCEEPGALSTPALAEYLAEQAITLQDTQQAEVNLEACSWIAEAAGRLRRGFSLTIDYGHEARELYDQRHMRGTLLAYQKHRAGEDFFRAPGEQDLTAHVNFTALDLHASRAGLQRTGFTSQSKFLLALARASDFADLQSSSMSESERTRATLLFKTLIYPEGMGETFQVLIQHKGIAPAHLSGLDPL
ncbi:MAG: SAM-dependent methyltransferase [Candidatus Acidiferrales bacterium]